MTAMMSTMRAFCAAVSFGSAEQLAEPRQHRLRPQLPHEVGDLVVPLGEVLVEVGEDGVAPGRVGAAGDVERGAVEVVLAVVELGECVEERLLLSRLGSAKPDEQHLAAQTAVV